MSFLFTTCSLKAPGMNSKENGISYNIYAFLLERKSQPLENPFSSVYTLMQ
jgi:hypothetical protein